MLLDERFGKGLSKKINFAKPKFEGRIFPRKNSLRQCERCNMLFYSLIFCVS